MFSSFWGRYFPLGRLTGREVVRVCDFASQSIQGQVSVFWPSGGRVTIFREGFPPQGLSTHPSPSRG